MSENSTTLRIHISELPHVKQPSLNASDYQDDTAGVVAGLRNFLKRQHQREKRSAFEYGQSEIAPTDLLTRNEKLEYKDVPTWILPISFFVSPGRKQLFASPLCSKDKGFEHSRRQLREIYTILSESSSWQPMSPHAHECTIFLSVFQTCFYIHDSYLPRMHLSTYTRRKHYYLRILYLLHNLFHQPPSVFGFAYPSSSTLCFCTIVKNTWSNVVGLTE